MAIALTPGYIYLIESVDDLEVGNDFITDDAGDPDDIDLTNYVEALDYCKIEMPQQFTKKFQTGIAVTDASGGISFERRWEKRAYAITMRGLSTTRANGALIDQFLTSARHTSGTVATYKTYYLILYFGVNDHGIFTDADGNRKSYCKGVVTNGALIWNQSRPNLYNVQLNWRSVWT